MGFFSPDDDGHDHGDDGSFFNPGGMKPAGWDRGHDRDAMGRRGHDRHDDRRDDSPWGMPGFLDGDVDDRWLDDADDRVRSRINERKNDRDERRRGAEERAHEHDVMHRDEEAHLRDELARSAAKYDRGPLDRHENALDAKLGSTARARLKSMSNGDSRTGGSTQAGKTRVTYGGYEAPEATPLDLIDENIGTVLWAVVIIVGVLVFMVKMAV